MSDESPGAIIRRARQEAHMKQRELADRMGVHPTTVGYWERNRFFPEQHWAALNKLLHINLRPPGTADSGGDVERGPDPTIPPEVRQKIMDAPRDDEWKRDAIAALEQLERGRRGEDRSPSGRRAG